MKLAVVSSLLFFALAGCGREAKTQTRDAGVVHINAASVEIPTADAGFVSAALELAPAVDAGGRGRPPLATVTTVGQTFDIPASTFASGSTPGDEGRDAALEPVLVDVTLGAYSVDALPYPNDPSAPPAMASSLEEAARMCEERGARLCTELEWEHACKGPNADPFATGATWSAACDASPSRCASGFGVRAMGFLREWTDRGGGAAVARGGPNRARRCAARSLRPRGGAKRAASSLSDHGAPASMAFRCCHGARNEASIAPVGSLPAFRKTDLDAADLAKIFAEVPELAILKENLRLYDSADVKTILARSSSDGEGIVFATAPILWSPEPGVELLVATGHSKRTGFVVALYPLPHDVYRFASSFLLLNESAPVALAYEPSRRKELRWTTCFQCAGEQGGVSLRDDGRTVIVQY